MKTFYTESSLSVALGVSRTDLAAFRRESLKKGRDWKRSVPQGIRLTEKACIEAVKHFGEPNIEEAIARLKEAALPKPPPIPTLLPDLVTVKVSALFPNPRRLDAVDSTGKVFMVLVPSNHVWTIKDPLRVKVSDENPNYWALANNPPRWRGDALYQERAGFLK